MKPKTQTQQTKCPLTVQKTDTSYKTAENNQENKNLKLEQTETGSPDLSSQLNPSGCGKAGKIYKGIKGNYWYANCGKPYLWERSNGKNIPLNKYLCPICSAKRLATAKALYNEKKKTLEFLNEILAGIDFYTKRNKLRDKVEELKSEIKQIENEVPEVKDGSN